MQARVLASTVTAALSFNDRQAAQEYVNAIRANPQIEAAAIYDSGGKLFAGYQQKPGRRVARRRATRASRISSATGWSSPCR